MQPREHQNQIQQDCTDSELDEPELVVGEVYGLRQWNFNNNPNLRGTPYLVGHHGGYWEPNEVNLAECGKRTSSVLRSISIPASKVAETDEDVYSLLLEEAAEIFADYPQATSLSVVPQPIRSYVGGISFLITRHVLAHPDLYREKFPWSIERCGSMFAVNGVEMPFTHLLFRAQFSVPVLPHPVAHPSCVCGFYAYTSPASLFSNSTTQSHAVFGIVKGYGHVTHGTKGFRMEKSEIVAVTYPQNRLPAGKGWYKSGDTLAQEDLRLYIPNHIPIHEDLDSLIVAASHLINFPEGSP